MMLSKPNNNVTILHFMGGDQAIYSYETLVAVLREGNQFKTETKHSKTTSKQLNQLGYKDAPTVTDNMLRSMLFDMMMDEVS